MGQYLQAGICYQLVIRKREFADVITTEQLCEELNKEFDISLFDVEETDEHVRFLIKEAVVLEQLHDFMQQQFSLYDGGYVDIFESILSKISQKKSLTEIIDFAKEKKSRFFNETDVYQHFTVLSWKSIGVKVSLLTFLCEGKILMECYGDFLQYLEKLVRSNSKQTIAGAFRAFID
ncbi:hypothetical protein EN829_033710 [Mesorhizobium sp. M00.F.Ca.ET.186.01.1.1]|uniref:hypothetical protein n=1 Tax=Brevibacillus borstelensis TaxID=45462 RepID=UPI001133D393|nr:hypothetical protein [Brevibacillus borstelensis]MCM3591232.1 hypothetical protein [Brevibacillus borstelensis]TGV31250.1 hypothetical protein EN829_033710 [Mesorhizobium sp. M00.F.Ca.ET.186.01.1.1]